MILFPAIDLKGGQCVRLKLGDMDQATIYNDDPGAQAKAFEDQGFSWLQVVDLDGAENHPRDALFQPVGDVIQIANATPQLHRILG